MADPSRIDRRTPLPHRVVELIFAKLLQVYGTQRILAMYEGMPLANVKEQWRQTLAGFVEVQVVHGLETLDADNPPNVLQFKKLCQGYRVPAAHRIEEEKPPSDLPRLHAALQRAHELQQEHNADPLAWAYRLAARHRKGENMTPARIAAYQTALGQIHGRVPEAVVMGDFRGIPTNELPASFPGSTRKAEGPPPGMFEE